MPYKGSSRVGFKCGENMQANFTNLREEICGRSVAWKNYRHRRDPNGNSRLTIRTFSSRKQYGTN